MKTKNKILDKINDNSYNFIPTYGESMSRINQSARSSYENKDSQFRNVINAFNELILKLPSDKYNVYEINDAITKTICNIYYLDKENNFQQPQGWESYKFFIEDFNNLLFKYKGNLYSRFDLNIVESKVLKNILTKFEFINASNHLEIETAIDNLYSTLNNYKFYSENQYATAYKYFYDKSNQIINIIPSPLYFFIKDKNIKFSYLNIGYTFYTCYKKIPIVYAPNEYARLINTNAFIDLFPGSFTQRDLPVLNKLLTELSKIVRAATKYEISENPCIYLKNGQTHLRYI